MPSLRTKLLITFFMVAFLFGLAIPMLIPNLMGIFAALLWFLVVMPAVFIKLVLYGRKKGLHGAKPYSRRAQPFKANGSISQGHHDSHVVPQTTRNGELVKSGGERMIADYLHENNIRYEYEKPVTDSKGRRISRPDFYLPDHNLYIEYWGMVNSAQTHKRQSYIKSMEWKKERYRENGKRFVSIYPQDLGDLEGVLKSRLQSESQA